MTILLENENPNSKMISNPRNPAALRERLKHENHSTPFFKREMSAYAAEPEPEPEAESESEPKLNGETVAQYETRAYRTIGDILQSIGFDVDHEKMNNLSHFRRFCDWGHVRYDDDDSKGDATVYIIMDQEKQTILFNYDLYAFKEGIQLEFNEKKLGIAMQIILTAMKLLLPRDGEEE
jgi:hypothetical protein